jgi:hypothetical protein
MTPIAVFNLGMIAGAAVMLVGWLLYELLP